MKEANLIRDEKLNIQIKQTALATEKKALQGELADLNKQHESLKQKQNNIALREFEYESQIKLLDKLLAKEGGE